MSPVYDVTPTSGDDPLARGHKLAYLRLIQRSRLSMPAHLLLRVMADYADADGTSCRPTQAALAAGMNTSARNVRRYLAELKAQGWIAVHEQGGRAGTVGRATEWHLQVGQMDEPVSRGTRTATSTYPDETVHLGGRGCPGEVDGGVLSPGQLPGHLDQVIDQANGPGNASDAPPRRALATADAAAGGPCAACGARPGVAEVLCNVKTGKAHLLDTLTAAQRKTYPHAAVLRYCLPCAEQVPARGWFAHTPAGTDVPPRTPDLPPGDVTELRESDSQASRPTGRKLT